ncbi:molybdenum cofactor biosynthesis protein C [Cyphellophora europaea CBS 101466]|uniref:Molybdenum cofactor biosynthesis protein C n=1 Tax=Cyphellophora europaea (strain CBS 101466) TaxID=1220924 RepID=W2SCF3_CYPE1|nr:molybdenum cofactor biosynthesis protein C [Cyphellophora europaea CBS 101466]ETN46300.1 molybdenum cofactor biosynthesis protein C [Cyphellophora europaea CBS 101466]
MSSTASTSPFPSSTPSPPSLTHLNSQGEAHMVSITHKAPTARSATATCTLSFSSPTTHAALTSATLHKGDALAVARIAGIQAAKLTSTLIPLAHPSLQITYVNVGIEVLAPAESSSSAAADVKSTNTTPRESGGARITARVDCEGKTGVEMEALTAAQVAGLALYDMLKGVDKGMCLGEGRVVAKRGGKSGGWRWDEEAQEVVKES